MSDYLLIDTNILVYSVSAHSLYHQEAKKFLEEKLSQNQVVLAVQNLVEFFATVTNKKYLASPFSIDEAVENLNLFAQAVKIVLDKPQTIVTLDSLIKKGKVTGQDVHDLHLAAVMIDNGIDTIYTADTKIFSRLGLKAINPLK